MSAAVCATSHHMHAKSWVCTLGEDESFLLEHRNCSAADDLIVVKPIPIMEVKRPYKHCQIYCDISPEDMGNNYHL